jgi:tungstate transport system substrate-binding protein
VESGLDMRATLELAVRSGAYVLTDCATWLTLKDHGSLEILIERDPRLTSLYEAVVVNPQRHPGANAAAAEAFLAWLVSAEGKRAIADFAIGAEHPFAPAGAGASN